MDYFFLGDAELVTAFRFIGIEGTALRDADEAVAVFRRITEGFVEEAGIALPDSLPGAEGCRVLIMTEEVAAWLDQFIIDWQFSGRYPLVVEIPGIAGKLADRKTLVDAIREAVGLHV
ncbi:MAG: V-type ATP synthase subunit F [Treponema sp.]|jgi:V/A-type H+-transporting ATPase subunit F|nr:V-type ATP synthase subunit F [Treponema sp.]